MTTGPAGDGADPVGRHRALEDRLDIQEVLYRYARMVDDKDWGQMDEIFAPDATVDYVSSGGQKGPYRETLAWLARALEPWPDNLHFISNLSIDLDGDRARSTCYFQAPMGRTDESGAQVMVTNAGHYDDELIRTARGWRIARRVCRQKFMIGQLPVDYLIPE